MVGASTEVIEPVLTGNAILVSFMICLNLTPLPVQKRTRDQDEKIFVNTIFVLEILASLELSCVILQ